MWERAPVLDFEVSKSDTERLSKMFLGLSDKTKTKHVITILKKAAKPILKITQDDARIKIKPNKGYVFNRKGTKYTIKSGTIAKSIGVIYNKKARVPMISVGYRAKDPYDGWFANWIDEGTNERYAKRRRMISKSTKRTKQFRAGILAGTKSNPSRGAIEARNIMPTGRRGIGAAEEIFRKELNKLLQQGWK